MRVVASLSQMQVVEQPLDVLPFWTAVDELMTHSYSPSRETYHQLGAYGTYQSPSVRSSPSKDLPQCFMDRTRVNFPPNISQNLCLGEEPTPPRMRYPHNPFDLSPDTLSRLRNTHATDDSLQALERRHRATSSGPKSDAAVQTDVFIQVCWSFLVQSCTLPCYSDSKHRDVAVAPFIIAKCWYLTANRRRIMAQSFVDY